VSISLQPRRNNNRGTVIITARLSRNSNRMKSACEPSVHVRVSGRRSLADISCSPCMRPSAALSAWEDKPDLLWKEMPVAFMDGAASYIKAMMEAPYSAGEHGSVNRCDHRTQICLSTCRDSRSPIAIQETNTLLERKYIHDLLVRLFVVLAKHCSPSIFLHLHAISGSRR